MTQLVGIVRTAGSLESSQDSVILRAASSVLYNLTKVRGFKTVVKFFPHEVVDLEPCLQLLARQDPLDHEVKECASELLMLHQTI